MPLLPMRPRRVSLEIAGRRFPARVSFAENISLKDGRLLGSGDVFHEFRVLISEREQVVDLTPYE